MKNPTGIRPVQFNVLIKVDVLDDQSAGGLYLPESAIQREQIAHDRGTIVAVSSMAFTDWTCKKPEIGDKVIFNKYAGSIILHQSDRASSRQNYRLCQDKDISAVIEEK